MYMITSSNIFDRPRLFFKWYNYRWDPKTVQLL